MFAIRWQSDVLRRPVIGSNRGTQDAPTDHRDSPLPTLPVYEHDDGYIGQLPRATAHKTTRAHSRAHERTGVHARAHRYLDEARGGIMAHKPFGASADGSRLESVRWLATACHLRARALVRVQRSDTARCCAGPVAATARSPAHAAALRARRRRRRRRCVRVRARWCARQLRRRSARQVLPGCAHEWYGTHVRPTMGIRTLWSLRRRRELPLVHFTMTHRPAAAAERRCA